MNNTDEQGEPLCQCAELHGEYCREEWEATDKAVIIEWVPPWLRDTHNKCMSGCWEPLRLHPNCYSNLDMNVSEDEQEEYFILADGDA